MPHFLAIPVKRDSQTPDSKFTKLPLYDKNGTAAIAVWAANSKWKVQTEAQSPRFLAEHYRQDGLVAYFHMRGLILNDKIAAFDENGAQQTAWMPINYAAGDRGTSVVRKSTTYNYVTLDARGSNQGHVPMVEEDWLDWVERCLVVIKSNLVGNALMTSTNIVNQKITIFPDANADQNADSSIRFTPRKFGSDFRPGARPNEILFHEFCHRAEFNFSGYSDVVAPSGASGPLTADDTFIFKSQDFFSVTASNVYCSLAKRPLRRDWFTGFLPMPKKYADSSALYASFFKDNMNSFKSRHGSLFSAIGAVSTPWNPFK